MPAEGSDTHLGARCREFESPHSDHLWSEKPSEMAVFLRLSPDFIVICQPWRCNMGIASVSKYVASLNEEQQRHICAFIEFMNAEFPQLSNKISFSMPMWLVGKR